MAKGSLLLLSLIVSATSFRTPPAHAIKSSRRFQLKANIVETATGAGKFKILAAAIAEAGLAPVFSGPGKFTVFAPSDEAFAALPEGRFHIFSVSNIYFRLMSGSFHSTIVLFASCFLECQQERMKSIL